MELESKNLTNEELENVSGGGLSPADAKPKFSKGAKVFYTKDLNRRSSPFSADQGSIPYYVDSSEYRDGTFYYCIHSVGSPFAPPPRNRSISLKDIPESDLVQ